VSVAFFWAVARCTLHQEIKNTKIHELPFILAYFNGVAYLDAA
jgi:hypothetical protein